MGVKSTCEENPWRNVGPPHEFTSKRSPQKNPKFTMVTVVVLTRSDSGLEDTLHLCPIPRLVTRRFDY